jgi:hypothetical protein
MLLQTWVDPTLHAWAKRKAKRRGLTVAAWLRQHLIDQKDLDK